MVAAFGWWGNTWLRQTIEKQLKGELSTTLHANVTALEIWTTNQMKLATVLAEEPKLHAMALELLKESDQLGTEVRRFPETAASRELANYLTPRLHKLGYGMAQLVTTNYTIVSDPMRGRPRQSPVVHEELKAKYAELFASGQPVIITPFKPRGPDRPPGSGGPGGPGGFGGPGGRGDMRADNFRRFDPNGRSREPGDQRPPDFNRQPPPEFMRIRKGDLTLMQVAAPVRDDKGVIQGALALVINPEAEFSKILSVARSGESGETYAFDQRGLMISMSRFEDQLKAMGLLENREGVSSALNLRLAVPRKNQPKSYKLEEVPSAAQPLIRLVTNAVAGGTGVEAVPSSDYRGVPVAGAWQWLPELGFGVVTQVDAAEAFRPLRVLQSVFTALVVLLLLGASGMFVFSYSNSVSLRKLSEVELKLKQLGQYTLEEKIGEGGMGVVYRARHALMRRETAVKLLLPGRADKEAVQRFEREVCLTCQLTHPNTIQVYDYGYTNEGIFYYAMEYLRGSNLQDLIANLGPLPEPRVVHILSEVCDALAEAHGVGLVHRDIKPANIFLCERGGMFDCVKVLDFGLVGEHFNGKRDPKNHSVAKAMLGTPLFMPPEAIKNASLSDPRSDIYSVGALGYFLLTGHYVFETEDVFELYEKHLKETPVPPSQRTTQKISPEFEGVILRCLNKDPLQRPQSAGELRAQLAATPRAGQWGSVAREAWWSQHRHLADFSAVKPPTGATTPVDATVKIDFASRFQG